MRFPSSAAKICAVILGAVAGASGRWDFDLGITNEGVVDAHVGAVSSEQMSRCRRYPGRLAMSLDPGRSCC